MEFIFDNNARQRMRRNFLTQRRCMATIHVTSAYSEQKLGSLHRFTSAGYVLSRRMVSLSRDVKKWLLSLDLRYPINRPKWDLANGCAVAEILSIYHPRKVTTTSLLYIRTPPRQISPHLCRGVGPQKLITRFRNINAS